MAVIRYDGSKSDSENNAVIVVGSQDELKKVTEFVSGMHDNAYENTDNNGDVDMVNHPSHYEHGIECIDEMILLYGVVETMIFCKLNSHKYRKRAFDKGGKEDMDKSDWYMKEYAYLDSKSDIEIKEEIYKKYNLLDN